MDLIAEGMDIQSIITAGAVEGQKYVIRIFMAGDLTDSDLAAVQGALYDSGIETAVYDARILEIPFTSRAGRIGDIIDAIGYTTVGISGWQLFTDKLPMLATLLIGAILFVPAIVKLRKM